MEVIRLRLAAYIVALSEVSQGTKLGRYFKKALDNIVGALQVLDDALTGNQVDLDNLAVLCKRRNK
jgi:hypothetical protein